MNAMCDEKDFDKFTLLMKLHIFPSPLAPSNQDLLGYTHEQAVSCLAITLGHTVLELRRRNVTLYTR